MEFLAEYTTTTMSEIKLNAETFRWLDRIPAILEEHSNIISRSRREAEEGLKVRIFLWWKLWTHWDTASALLSFVERSW